jgi:hypothetical protein
VVFYFSFFLEKKRNKKLFAGFILFLTELMRTLRLVQGKPDRSPEIRDFSMPTHGKSPSL